jgi:hypothetical protein
MKKIVLIVVLVASISAQGNAQQLNTDKVPTAVKTAFVQQYPGITAKWEKEEGLFEASFKLNGTSVSVMYKANGTLTETETDIKVNELPAAALAYVKEHYKGKVIKEAAKITKADGTVNYETEVNGKDVMFDTNGSFLKEEKE